MKDRRFDLYANRNFETDLVARLRIHPGVSLGAPAMHALERLAGMEKIVEVGGDGEVIPPMCEIRGYDGVLQARASGHDHDEAVEMAEQLCGKTNP